MIKLKKNKGKYIYIWDLIKKTRKNKDNKTETFLEIISFERKIYEKKATEISQKILEKQDMANEILERLKDD